MTEWKYFDLRETKFGRGTGQKELWALPGMNDEIITRVTLYDDGRVAVWGGGHEYRFQPIDVDGNKLYDYLDANWGGSNKDAWTKNSAEYAALPERIREKMVSSFGPDRKKARAEADKKLFGKILG